MISMFSCKEDQNEYEKFLLDKIWDISEPQSDSIQFMRNFSDQLLFSIEPYGKSKNCTYKRMNVRWRWIDDNSIEIYKLIDSGNDETIEELNIIYLDEMNLLIYFYDKEGKRRDAKYINTESPN